MTKIEEICEMSKQGKMNKEIADHFGFSTGYIATILRKNGICHRSPLPEDEIIASYQETRSSKKTAERFNIHPRTVLKVLKRNNIKADGLQYYRENAESHGEDVNLSAQSKDIAPQVIDHYRMSGSANKTADYFGINEKTVLRILCYFGVSTDKQISQETISHNTESKRLEYKRTEEHNKKISQAHLERNPDAEEMCEMAKAGKCVREIAEFFGRTQSSVRKILVHRGMKAQRGPSIKKGVSAKPEKIVEICEMAKQGMTAQEIADHYNEQGYSHSAGHIYKILDSQNIEIPRYPGGRPNANPSRIEQICDMFTSGSSVKEIAEHFGFNGQTYVYRVLGENGLEVCQKDPDRVEKIREMFKNGMTVKEISDSFDFSGYSYVSKVLTSCGLRSRKPNTNLGYTIDKAGYKWVRMPPDDPMKDLLAPMVTKAGIVLEHRLVMAKHYGRPLGDNEQIHHINGDKLDNRVENLQLMTRNHGNGIYRTCYDCGSDNVKDKDDYTQCCNCGSSKIKNTKIKSL